MTNTHTLAIRSAQPDDAADVARIAALDSAPVPPGELLLGVVDGRAVAALSTTTGDAIGDPFARTDDVVRLLRQSVAMCY